MGGNTYLQEQQTASQESNHGSFCYYIHVLIYCILRLTFVVLAIISVSHCIILPSKETAENMTTLLQPVWLCDWLWIYPVTQSDRLQTSLARLSKLLYLELKLKVSAPEVSKRIPHCTGKQWDDRNDGQTYEKGQFPFNYEYYLWNCNNSAPQQCGRTGKEICANY